jgi:hypothetical protein
VIWGSAKREAAIQSELLEVLSKTRNDHKDEILLLLKMERSRTEQRETLEYLHLVRSIAQGNKERK